MRGLNVGSVIGAVFGLVYALVNSGGLPSVVAAVLRILAVLALAAVLVTVLRHRDPGAAGPPPGSDAFGPRYLLVVGVEVVAVFGGVALLNGPLDLPDAGVAWVSVVVGLHFLPLAGVFGLPLFRALGLAVAACGAVGLLLAATLDSSVPVDVVGGILPGALLLAASWWGAGRDLRQPVRV